MSNHIKTLFGTLVRIFKYGIPSHIIAFGDALGDNLLLTVLTRELYDRGFKNVWIKSDRSELFEHNPHIKLILPFNTLLSGTMLKMCRTKIVYPKYTVYHKETDMDEMPEKHIVLKMADYLQLHGRIQVKPVLSLTPDERRAAEWAKNKIVITTSATAALFPMGNKEWSVEKYQEVVNFFRDKYEFIQVGALTDAPLFGVTDMRGKTTIRQTAAILSNAALLVSHVGFIMHLARAVDCRAVILYGGRERPDQSGYSCFENIYSAIECAPCWLHNTCPHDKKCMQLIVASTVTDTIVKQVNLTGTSLSIDILVN